MPAVAPDPATLDDLTEREEGRHRDDGVLRRWDSGYSKQQSTRPQTIGYSLVDSPAGLCAWIIEKFWSWTDCDGDPANVLTRDEMLDNVMMYWLPGTGASSARLYWESFRKPIRGTVTVPVGCSIFPKEIFRPSRRWAERQFPDLRYWNEPARAATSPRSSSLRRSSARCAPRSAPSVSPWRVARPGLTVPAVIGPILETVRSASAVSGAITYQRRLA